MTGLSPLVEPGPPLDPAATRRYARQLLLPEIGVVGQRRLQNARVLVLGAGGLGSPVVTALAASGVGTLGVVDDGLVEESNLHRQTLHATDAIGRRKVDSAVSSVARLNPLVTVVPLAERLDDDSAARLLDGWDLVVDGMDTFSSRYAADAAAAAAGIPLVWGSVLGFDGQVSVFWSRAPGGPIGLRDLHPDQRGTVDTCSTVGVLGPLCTAVGGMMAAEAIKLIVGAGTPALGRVLVVDALDATWREIALRPAGETSVAHSRASGSDSTGPGPAEASPVSALPVAVPSAAAPSAAAPSAAAPSAPSPSAGGSSALLDVREDDERAAEPGPAGSVGFGFTRLLDGERPDIPRDAAIGVFCASGRRARAAADLLADGGWTHVRSIGALAEARALAPRTPGSQ